MSDDLIAEARGWDAGAVNRHAMSALDTILRLADALEAAEARLEALASDEAADRANLAFHEFCFGPGSTPVPQRELGITRQAWKCALAAAVGEDA